MKNRKIFIITGEQGEGKTTRLLEVTEQLKLKNISLKGFVAEGQWKDGVRTAFQIRDIDTGASMKLCQNKQERDFVNIGRFYFNPKALVFGKNILQLSKATDLVVIDEIGLFEMKDKVWAGPLKDLMGQTENPLLITVRKKFLHKVVKHFSFEHPLIFNISQDAQTIAEAILKSLGE